MKYLILCALLCSFPFNGDNENLADLEHSVKDYFRAIESQDHDQVLDLLYPPLFRIVPREDLKALFTEMSGDPTLKISVGAGEILAKSEVFSHAKKQYISVKYHHLMELSFTEDDADPSVLLEMMKLQYGEKHVVYDENLKTLSVKVIDYLYAIQGPETVGWKFLSRNLNFMFEDLIPNKVHKALQKASVQWLLDRYV